MEILYIYTMSRVSKLLFFNVIMLAGSFVKGQTPAYLHYDVSNGLPGNIVYCAAQDDRGLMWFGTDKGLACFDGVRFRTYGVKNGLPDPEVLNLKLDSKGRLWISCFRKKPCYWFQGKIYTEKEDKMLGSVNFDYGIYLFFEDNNQNIWFSGGGRKVFLLRDSVFSEFQVAESAFYTFPLDGKIYTLNKTYFYMLDEQNQFAKIADFGFVNPEISLTGAVKRDDHILISRGENLYIYSINGERVTLKQTYPHLFGTLFLDHLKRYWVCNTQNGVVCFNNTSGNLANPVSYLKGKKVTTMFEDNNRNFWFCTVGEGIYILPETSSQFYTANDGLRSNNITAIAKMPDGKITAGDDQGNIYTVTNNSIKHIANLGNGGLNRTRHLVPNYPEPGIFAVTDLGVSLLTGKNIIKIPNTRSSKDILFSEKEIYIATASNLQSVDPHTFAKKLITGERSTALAMDNEGFIWAGGIEGVYSSADSFHINRAEAFPVLKNRIIALKKSRDGSILAVVPEYGVIRYSVSNGAITDAQKLNDLLPEPVENVQSLFEESNGRLWLSTNSGIYGIDTVYHVLHFDRYNSLTDDDINSVVVDNDTVWAGTISGLSKIILGSGRKSDDFRTLISEVRYTDNEKKYQAFLSDSFALAPKYILPGGASLVELDMAGLIYNNQGNQRFQCIIDKKLPVFHHWTTGNLIDRIEKFFRPISDTTYIAGNTFNFGAYLAPGRYDIQVRAIAPSGQYSTQPAGLILVKEPNWYETVWFFAAIWLTGLYVVGRIVRTGLAYRRLQTAVAELQLQAIQAQINPHFIGNSINAIQQFFYPPDPVKASDYIAVFTRLLRTTMDFLEKPFVPLSEEMVYNEDYLKMIKLRFGTRFQYSIFIAKDVNPGTLFPTMILQPILENATIHGLSPDEQSILEISITKTGNGIIQCTVSDNGIGFNKSKLNNQHRNKPHKSKGLLLLFKKVSTLNELYHINANLEIQDISETDTSKHGTSVTLRFSPTVMEQVEL